MHLGMALAAGLCLAIGIYPTPLYNLLPFNAEYHPYTSVHLIETMQLLVFAGLGFWLLINKLGGKPVITLDTDWFYRRPSRLAYNVFVVFISNLFGAVERLTLRLTRIIIRLSANPIGYMVGAKRLVESVYSGNEQATREPAYFDPGRYRISAGAMVLVVLFSFVLLLIWELIAS
jgi:hypothetical protein